jgi:hypothetical protein
MCHQRRSAAGRRRAGCPTSAPWAATDATPTGRSGPCWKPCPSHPRSASHAPRPTAPASLLSVARRPFGIVLRSIGVVSDPGHGRIPPCEREAGARTACDPGRGAGELRRWPTVGVHCCQILGWSVAPVVAPGSRALEGISQGEHRSCADVGRRGQSRSPRAVVTARNRSYPLAGHAEGTGAPRGSAQPGDTAWRGHRHRRDESHDATARDRGNKGPRMPRASGTAAPPRLGRSGTGNITLFSIHQTT